MAYTQFQVTKPAGADDAPDVIEDIQQNFPALLDGIITGDLYGWDIYKNAGSDEKPSQILADKGSERLVFVLQYNDDDCVWYLALTYSPDLVQYWSIGVLTITYDDDCNVTGFSWS